MAMTELNKVELPVICIDARHAKAALAPDLAIPSQYDAESGRTIRRFDEKSAPSPSEQVPALRRPLDHSPRHDAGARMTCGADGAAFAGPAAA